MPVDLHPKLKKPGVEVILTTLHAGGKVLERPLPLLGRSARRRRLRRQRAVEEARGLDPARRARVRRDVRDREIRRRRRAAPTRRHRRAAQHRDDHPLLAGRQVLRLGEDLVAEAPSPAQGEGPVLCPGLRRAVCSTRRAGSATTGATRTGSSTTSPRPSPGSSGCRAWPLSGAMSGRSEAADLGRDVAARGRRGRPGELRQPGPDRAGRHPRERSPRRSDRRDPGVLRFPQPSPARRQDHPPRTSGTVSPTCCRSSSRTRSSPGRRRSGCPRATCAGFVANVVKDHNRAVAQPSPRERGPRSRASSSRAPRRAAARGARSCARRSRAARRFPASSPTAPRPISPAPSSSSSRGTRRGAPPSRRGTGSSRRSCRCGARS